MKHAILTALLLFVLPATTAFPQENMLQHQILAKERQELDCLKSGNYTEFAGLLADDAVFVDSHGSAGKAEVVQNTSQVRLDDYAMDDIKFLPLSATSGLLVYKLTEAGTSHGKSFAAKVHVSAIWSQQNGKWVCQFSQETTARQ